MDGAPGQKRLKPTRRADTDALPFITSSTQSFAPLAERMRPQSLDEVAGHESLIGPGKPLRMMIERGKLHSMIFWVHLVLVRPRSPIFSHILLTHRSFRFPQLVLE